MLQDQPGCSGPGFVRAVCDALLSCVHICSGTVHFEMVCMGQQSAGYLAGRARESCRRAARRAPQPGGGRALPRPRSPRPAGVGSDFRYNPMKVKETRIFLPCGARQTKRPTKHHATVANRRSNVQVPHYQPRNFTTGQSNFSTLHRSRDRDSADGGPYACPRVQAHARCVNTRGRVRQSSVHRGCWIVVPRPWSGIRCRNQSTSARSSLQPGQSLAANGRQRSAAPAGPPSAAPGRPKARRRP